MYGLENYAYFLLFFTFFIVDGIIVFVRGDSMRENAWKKAAIASMKQHGFLKNIINHKFYCEWKHCLAVAEFEYDKAQQGMRVRLDMYIYERHDIVNVLEPADETGYLTKDGHSLFSLNMSKEEVYDTLTEALKESIPLLIGKI